MKDLLEKLNSTNTEDRHVRDMLLQVAFFLFCLFDSLPFCLFPIVINPHFVFYPFKNSPGIWISPYF